MEGMSIIKKYGKKALRYNKKCQLYRAKKTLRYVRLDSKQARCVYLNKKEDKCNQFRQMLENIKIDLQPDKIFQYWIDEGLLFFNDKKVIGNLPPDYCKVIDYSLLELIEKNKNNDEISQHNKELLQAVLKYIDRILLELKKQPQTNHIDKAIIYFSNMKTRKADSLEEALQRILFWSSLFWQSGHRLVGLGRLDKVLNRFVDLDDRDVYIAVLKDFLLGLHDYYGYKSSVQLGDTGQIIILGGLEEDGSYFCNMFTYLFIEALMQLQIPDPKILLRVGEVIPEDLLKLATQCISTGIGSPLLSNDHIVIPVLQEFGFKRKDAFNYVTSACWEPVSYGNSLEQNNIGTINFSVPFTESLRDMTINNIASFEDFLSLYEKKLRIHVRNVLKKISTIDWEEDPLFTLFTDGCVERGMDIAAGGAVYNDYGILSVGMGNTVNSFLKLNEMVFTTGEISLSTICQLWNNSISHEVELKTLSKELARKKSMFGHDVNESIRLTNQLLDIVSSEICSYRNKFGGKVKFGLSSPNYIAGGKLAGYTFDGRKKDDPLTVHISADDGVAYTELISFASQLHYTGWSANANVVDFFVSPDFINNNLEKFLKFLRISIQKGFFQMQMNVVSSDKLIEAKNNPEKFPDLIVRVWGFSAYFKDLSEEYQDVLIQRALKSERN